LIRDAASAPAQASPGRSTLAGMRASPLTDGKLQDRRHLLADRSRKVSPQVLRQIPIADSVRSLAAPGMSVAARRSPGSGVLGQWPALLSSWQERHVPVLGADPGAGAGLARPGRRAERSSLSGRHGCASSASRRSPSRVSVPAWQTVEQVQQYRERRVITDPADRSVLNRPAGTWSGAATIGSSARCSTGSSNDSAPSGWASRRRPARDGPLVPAKTGRSSLGRRWSRADKGEQKTAGQRGRPGGSGRGLIAPDNRRRRCLLHIPFGISAVREGQVQPPIDRSRRAG